MLLSNWSFRNYSLETLEGSLSFPNMIFRDMLCDIALGYTKNAISNR